MLTPRAAEPDVGYPARLVPCLSTLLFAVISVVPLNLPGFAVVTPAFALMAAFHWTVYRPGLLPLSAVFAIGLSLDLLNGTPYVGLSALTLLLARAVVMSQRQFFLDRSFPVVWLGFLVLTVGNFAFLWAFVSMLYGAPLGLRPFVFQAVLTVSCFPVGSYLLARAHRAFLIRA